MPELEPITIEINEDETVIMEIDGVQTVLYEGKPRPKKKPAPKKVVKPAPAPAPEPEPQPETIIVVEQPVKKGSPIQRKRPAGKRLRPTRALAKYGPGTSDDSQHSIHTVGFEDKLRHAPKAIAAMYRTLRDYLVETYGCSHRISFGYDSYRVGKKVVVALSLGGVHLRVNAAIDPKVYEGTKMHVNDDSDSKKYKDMPSYIKVMSDKTLKQAMRLIDDTMKGLGVKKIKAE